MNNEIRDDLQAVLLNCISAIEGLMSTGGKYDHEALVKATKALRKAKRACKVLREDF